MKQKLFILLILSIVLVGSANAEVPPNPTDLVSDTSQSGHVLWSWLVGTGNITDSYNMSVNSIWYNGSSSASYNHNVGTGKTSTIIVYAYNNTGVGNVSSENITGSQRGVLTFTSISNVIQAIIPIFSSLIDLTIAVVPYMFLVMMVGSLILMFKAFFKRKIF